MTFHYALSSDITGSSASLCQLALVRKIVCTLLPVLTVKLDYDDLLRSGIQAIYINIDTIGIRTRRVERFYSTDFAKSVFSNLRVKLVSA